MRVLMTTLTTTVVVASANPAWADLAPEPYATGPSGVLVLVAVAAAIGALALIWLRRRR
jgi:LPXTG-motif cell wall-anchored protein